MKRSNGRLTVLVHPFMDYVSDDYQQRLKSILTQVEGGDPILILDSEGQFYGADRQTVNTMQLENGGGDTYFVPTYTANPEPVLHPVLGGFTNDVPDNSGWTALISTLKSAGVKSCRVDVLFSDNSPIIPLGQETSSPACVNRTMNALCSSFEVERIHELKK